MLLARSHRCCTAAAEIAAAEIAAAVCTRSRLSRRRPTHLTGAEKKRKSVWFGQRRRSTFRRVTVAHCITMTSTLSYHTPTGYAIAIAVASDDARRLLAIAAAAARSSAPRAAADHDAAAARRRLSSLGRRDDRRKNRRLSADAPAGSCSFAGRTIPPARRGRRRRVRSTPEAASATGFGFACGDRTLASTIVRGCRAWRGRRDEEKGGTSASGMRSMERDPRSSPSPGRSSETTRERRAGSGATRSRANADAPAIWRSRPRARAAAVVPAPARSVHRRVASVVVRDLDSFPVTEGRES